MAEHLDHVNNWFSKSETDRAEEMHYSVFVSYIFLFIILGKYYPLQQPKSND